MPKQRNPAAASVESMMELGSNTAPMGSSREPCDPEKVASRAYLLWEQSGRLPGRDLENWLQAEREIRAGDFGGNGAATTQA